VARLKPDGKNPYREGNMPDFGELLRRLRSDRSQREIAADLKMPVTTLSTLENQRTIPRGPVLKKFADYYGVALAYFYSNSASEMKPTGAASAWLQAVRRERNVKETIATYATADYPDEVKDEIGQKIAAKIAENKRGHKTSRRNET
jgi:transcriptional regulator with XRE-family HTH domain